MADIVRDIVETHQAQTTTPDYRSPNGFGAILEGIAKGFGDLVDYAQKGAAKDAKAAKEKMPLEPGMQLVQEVADKISSTQMSPAQRQLEVDNAVKGLDRLGYDASAQKSILSLTGVDKTFETVKKFQTDAAEAAVAQDKFYSDIADAYGIQGTAEQRWSAGAELFAAKTAAYQAKQGLKRMTTEAQEKFVEANPQMMRTDILTDMRAAVVRNGGFFDTRLLEEFKRAKTAELAENMDLALASKIVDYALTDYEALAKKQREGTVNTQKELEDIQKLEETREWQNYLNSAHTMTINGETVTMTGQQIEASRKAFGPEAWGVIISQNMTNLVPFMSGLGAVQDLPQTSYKYFINGSMGPLVPGMTDEAALKNIDAGTAEALKTVKEDLSKLPRSVRNTDKLSYAETVAWLQAYDPWSKEQVDKAFAGKEAEKPIRAMVGARGIAKGLNDRSNDYAFIQIDSQGNVRVFRNSILNRISGAFADPSTGKVIANRGGLEQGQFEGIKVDQKPNKPILEEITGEGRFIALGSYDAFEAGQISDMALSVISNMTKFGMSPEEARRAFNRAQIEGSTAAQRFVNMMKDYEAGRSTVISADARNMDEVDVKIVEDALQNTSKTVSASISQYAPPEGIDWSAVAAQTFGALPYEITRLVTESASESKRAVREEELRRALQQPLTIKPSKEIVKEPERSRILKEKGIEDSEAVVYTDGTVSYTDSEGRHWDTLPYEGTIDLKNRKVVKNPDGTISTENSIVIEEDGQFIIIPTVVNGKIVSEDEAVQHYHRTGEHLGKYLTQFEAVKQSEQIHEQQARRYLKK